MKVAVISRSAVRGGAAVVSRRLAEALAGAGADVTLVVMDGADETEADGIKISRASKRVCRPVTFLAERVQVLFHNGFSLRNLWKVDTASFGLPLWRHPAVKEADVVILNWFNQGMLSLKGVGKIASMGKNIIWVMHDMWPFTGICHHAMGCRRFEGRCCSCPFLGSRKPGKADLSTEVQERKRRLYSRADIRFVAVSNWLRGEAQRSSLLQGREVEVIHNPFTPVSGGEPEGERRGILFVAAGLDNWIKGLDTFKQAVGIFSKKYPALAEGREVTLVGSLKDPGAIEGFALPVNHLGTIFDESALAAVYRGAEVVVNSSWFENLPGTLVEGQAYGAVPVAFDRGGQRDIINHLHTGYLAPWSDNGGERAEAMADGIAWALANGNRIAADMRVSVAEKFSPKGIAARYLSPKC